MRRRIKYRLPDSNRSSGGVFLWLVAFLVLGIIGWVWWQAARPSGSEQKPGGVHPLPAARLAEGRRATTRLARSDTPAPPRRSTNFGANTKASTIALASSANPTSQSLTPSASPGTAQSNAQSVPPAGFPRPAQDVFEAQLALDRQGISSGSIDGVIGPQTRSALRAFQRKACLPPTGELDAATRERLSLATPPCATCAISSNDLARLQPLSPTWLGKSQQTALEYETILELVAEKGHAHPNLIRRLNPGLSWSNVTAGTTVRLPDAACPDSSPKAAFLTIHLADKILEAFDANTNLLAHFPCSIAKRFEKRPVGQLHVEVIAPNPNYTFDPEVFPESAEASQLKTKLVLPPGPNNPVGVAWIGLDKPGYGIHGTPSPEQVGRTESHGCFRLANWNAEYLVRLVTIGTPVVIQP